MHFGIYSCLIIYSKQLALLYKRVAGARILVVLLCNLSMTLQPQVALTNCVSGFSETFKLKKDVFCHYVLKIGLYGIYNLVEIKSLLKTLFVGILWEIIHFPVPKQVGFFVVLCDEPVLHCLIFS